MTKCKETSIRLPTDYRVRKERHYIFKVMKQKNLRPRMFYPARPSFRFDGEIKSFPDKQKLREFSVTKPALQQMLKELVGRKQDEKKTYKK